MDSGHSPRNGHDRSALNLPAISNNFTPHSAATPSSPVNPKNNDSLGIKPKQSDAATAETTGPSSPKNTPTALNYAAAVRPRQRKPDLPAHRFQALHASSLGGVDTLSIPLEFYKERIADFKHALIGRLMLRKGTKPKLVHELKGELQNIWKISNSWQLIPMGKGFFTLKFSSLEDKKTAKGKLNLDLSQGQLRLREWVPKFDPYKEFSSMAQVWVRIYYLPIELWHPEVISAIGRYLGNPIRIDGGSADRDVGHYARVLIELDLSLPLRESLMIEEDNSSIYVEFSYEALPPFCQHCKLTGHLIDKCRRYKSKETKKVDSEKKIEPSNTVRPMQTEENSKKLSPETEIQKGPVWQQKQQLEPVTITETRCQAKVLLPKKSVMPMSTPTNNTFEVLEDLEINEKMKGTDMPELVDEPSSTLNHLIVIDEEQNHDPEIWKAGVSTDNNPDLKALAIENAMKIQKLEAYIQEQEVAKRRGRPPGSGRGGKTLHTPAADSIKHRLRKSAEMGDKVQNYIIEAPERPSLRTMDNMAAKSWAAEMEREETPSPHF
ncbi:uncharacterized protein LOC131025726 [Salvia miltiorrhiza]|uniref:uncharacterized protein LOC131025726 n=1 Tax=Salvia miltiorrhiza TaxID=226208 RepID=UPI0025ABAAEF|nr:uncharacterized protein LOC131025726 [Salvia miltiorrhiza]